MTSPRLRHILFSFTRGVYKRLKQRISVEVEFATHKLERCYLESAAGIRAWGQAVARKYIQRIDILQDAANVEEVRRIPELGWHALKGDKSGKFGMLLHGRWRLTISLRGDAARIVRIEEVSKHYGD